MARTFVAQYFVGESVGDEDTSFNVRGEPIVETPTDAMRCFLATDIDVLVIHDVLIEKRWTYPLALPFMRFADRVRQHLPQ